MIASHQTPFAFFFLGKLLDYISQFPWQLGVAMTHGALAIERSEIMKCFKVKFGLIHKTPCRQSSVLFLSFTWLQWRQASGLQNDSLEKGYPADLFPTLYCFVKRKLQLNLNHYTFLSIILEIRRSNHYLRNGGTTNRSSELGRGC